MKFVRYKPLVILFLLLGVGPGLILAQENCPTIVTAALEAVDKLCADIGRNQACYGNVLLSAEPQPGADNFVFEQAGDIVDVTDLQSMELTGLDEEAATWGVAVMRLQASIPDSLPGQNVTFLLFGDVTIESAVEDGSEYTPMQAFYLTTGIGDAACEEAPDSGLLVQTPEGVSEVTFNVNGVDVAMGSTVLFQAVPGEDMTISAIEGMAVLEVEDEVNGLVAGTRLQVPMDEHLRPRGAPDLPQSYENRHIRGLPVGALQRPIDIAPPLDSEHVDILHQRMINGEAPCGVDGLPPCDHLPMNFLGARGLKPCIPDAEADNRSDERIPLCSEVDQDRPPVFGGGRFAPGAVVDCVVPPGPDDPPLDPDDTRPECPYVPPDDYPCVVRPREGIDPPMDPRETRPYCEDIGIDSPPPPGGQDERPPVGDGVNPLPGGNRPSGPGSAGGSEGTPPAGGRTIDPTPRPPRPGSGSGGGGSTLAPHIPTPTPRPGSSGS